MIRVREIPTLLTFLGVIMTKITSTTTTPTTSLSFPFNLINSGISFQPFAAASPELIEITRIFRHLQLHKQVIYAAA